jgi:hypothetical protein
VRIISNIINRRKVWDALADYPIYSPPFRGTHPVLSQSEIKANYDYFLEQKSLRLEYLAKYLARFFVELHLSHEALPDLEKWLYRYGGYLIPGSAMRMALDGYGLTWLGEYHGVNIIYDISIFVGDFVVSKNKNARWDVWYGDGGKRDYEKEGFGQPCIFGLPHGYKGHYWIVRPILEYCRASNERRKRGRNVLSQWSKPGTLVRMLDYVADPNAPPPVPVSQRVLDR